MKKLILTTLTLSMILTSSYTSALSKGEKRFQTANSFYFGIFNINHLKDLTPSEESNNILKYDNKTLSTSQFYKMYLTNLSVETDDIQSYVSIRSTIETQELCKKRVWSTIGSYYMRTYEKLAMKDKPEDTWMTRVNRKSKSNVQTIDKNDFDYVDDGYSIKASFNYLKPKRKKGAESVQGDWLIKSACAEDGSFFYHSRNVYKYDRKDKNKEQSKGE